MRLFRAWVAAAAALIVAVPLSGIPAEAKPRGGDSAVDAPREHARPVPGAKPVRPQGAADRSGAVSALAAAGTCVTTKYTDPVGSPVLRVDEGCDLDQYLFRSGGPIDFAIDNDTYGGPVGIDNRPVIGHNLYQRQVLLTLRVYDVDEDYTGSNGNPEVDQVFVNGSPIGAPSHGLLTGANNQWSTVSFRMNSSLLHFPAAAGEIAVNNFQVHIDLNNGGANRWAVQVDWAELRLTNDVVPVALIHGFTAKGADMNDIKQFYEDNVWQLAGKVITPNVTSTGSIEANEQAMRQPINVLKQRNGASQVTLVAHSMGGLDSRLYAWNNKGSVRNVVMIATPNGGSPLANILCDIWNEDEWERRLGRSLTEELILWLARDYGKCRGPEDALYQLQEDYIRNVFNKQVRDHTAGTGYATIAGRFVGIGSPTSGGDDDGVVPLESVRWLDRDGVNGGVHQSLEPIFDPMEHNNIIKAGSGAIPRSLCHAYPGHYACGTIEPTPFAVMSAPTSTDRMQVAGMNSAVVPAGGSAQISLSLEAAAEAELLILTDAGVTGSYNGAPLTPTKAFGRPALGIHTTGGAGVVTLNNPATVAAPAIAVASVRTSRTLTVTAPAGLPKVGTPVTATVTLTDAGPTEQVTYQVLDATGAEVATGTAVNTGPGNWLVGFTPTAVGAYEVRVWTAGARLRSDHTTVPIGAADGRAIGTGATWTAPDVNGDGRRDALDVSVPITAPTGGTFQLAADLIGPGGQTVAAAGATVTIPAGSGSAVLRFDGQDIYRSGVDGPYTLANVLLSDANMRMLDTVTTLSTSANYTAGSFDHYEVEIDQNAFADQIADADANRYAEALAVRGGVRVDTAGWYVVNARLLAPNGQEIAQTQQTVSLVSGHNPFTMTFPWSAIADDGLNGPYTVADLSVYPVNNVSNGAFLPSAHTTKPYLASGLINAAPVVTAGPVSLEGNTTGGFTGTIPGASANDPDGDTLTLSSNAANPVPLGPNSIVWTATDVHGASGSALQSVTVRDTTAPSISCPANVSSASNAPALGSPTAADTVDATVTVTNNAPATFSPGTTAVTWQARDDSGNSATCQQQVTVTGTPTGNYTFVGFFSDSTHVGSSTTCNVPAIPYNTCYMRIAWQLKDSNGNYVTSPAAITGYSWGGTGGSVRYDATTNRFMVNVQVSGVAINSIFQFTVSLADGTSKTLRVQMVPGEWEES